MSKRDREAGGGGDDDDWGDFAQPTTLNDGDVIEGVIEGENEDGGDSPTSTPRSIVVLAVSVVLQRPGNQRRRRRRRKDRRRLALGQ